MKILHLHGFFLILALRCINSTSALTVAKTDDYPIFIHVHLKTPAYKCERLVTSFN